MVPGVAYYLTLALMLQTADSARILGVFMIDAFSHFNINHAVMEILAMAGHEVTIISTLKPKNPSANITYIRAKKKQKENASSWSQDDMTSMSWWKLHKFCQVIMEEDCELFMGLQETKDILASKEKKYDLMFTEVILTTECFLPIAQRQNIPVIATLLFELRYMYQARLGNPYHPSVIPHALSPYGSKMTFIQRLRNTIETMYLDFLVTIMMKSYVEKFYQKYYPNDDPWTEKLSLLFLNSHSTISPFPNVPGIIEIGGVHLKESQPLPQHMEEFIRGAQHGVILFSFGTVAHDRDFTIETMQKFLNVFAKIPQRVMWKFGNPVEGISDNVMISNWIPQSDVLAHENVVLFISHMGKSSTMEAIHRGKPVLALPLFGDQINNAAIVEELGGGIVLDRFTLTEASLLSSIQELVQNNSYKDRMKKVARAFNDRPMTPKETVLYWTDYVLKHNGTEHLQTASVNMPSYRNFLIDVILLLVFTLISISLLVWLMVKKIFGVNFFGNKK